MGALEASWKDLERRARPPFFLTWAWIGTWLESISPASGARLLRAERGGETVGLGIVVPHTQWRHGFVRSRGLYLHCTGDPVLDEILVEHNGFLAEEGTEAAVTKALFARLLAANDWDELFLDGMSDPQHLEALDLGGAKLRTVRSGPSRYVDLAAVRAGGKGFTESLGKSTRYNVRRSGREFEKVGPLALAEARTLAEAREYMGRLRELHQRYWISRGHPGSFAEPAFVRFHERLVERAFGEGAIQLLRVTAGAEELGYLYNHVHRGHVYNYQSGFAYPGGNLHQRPGLVAHALAIDHNVALGHSVYDFLAGDSDFKRSLSNAEKPLAWLVLQRPRLALRLEEALRRTRARLRRREPAPAEAE